MRFIRKRGVPEALQRFQKDTTESPNRGYNSMPAKEVRLALAKEQYFLCAYTGVHIEAYNDPARPDKCHIEHVMESQGQTRTARQAGWLDEDEVGPDVDYNNLVACWPGETPGKELPGQGWGAPEKPGDFDRTRFISPLQENCEQQFAFDWIGRAGPARPGEPRACYTIDLLKLNHYDLASRRRAVILTWLDIAEPRLLRIPRARQLAEGSRGAWRQTNVERRSEEGARPLISAAWAETAETVRHGEGWTFAQADPVPVRAELSASPLSSTKARERAESVNRPHDGKLTQFCFAVRQVLLWYASWKEREEARARFARRTPT